LLVTINSPPTFTSFIDRILASAEAYHINTILVFNKIDLYNKEENLIKEKLIQLYTNIGYKCMEVSAITKQNIDQLKTLMKDKTNLFVGHSGAGKSTLANAIDKNLSLKVNTVSLTHKQGQHTTTFAEMFELPFGGYLIDTPGIKGFGVVDFDKEEVGDYFIEFFKLKQHCKFNNCLHINEPNCAVKNALEDGKIAKSRYKNYLQIIKGENEHYRIVDYEF
jgi:ribosome biogenesis GTPase